MPAKVATPDVAVLGFAVAVIPLETAAPEQSVVEWPVSVIELVESLVTVFPLASWRVNTGWLASAVSASPVADGWVVNEITLNAPALTAMALEQAVRVPSLAPIRIALVFKTFTPANVAIPLDAVTGFVVAAIPLATEEVHEASE